MKSCAFLLVYAYTAAPALVWAAETTPPSDVSCGSRSPYSNSGECATLHGAEVVQDDIGLDPAIGMLQKALLAKRAASALNASHMATVHGAATNWSMQVSPCIFDMGSYEELPYFALEAHADLLALRELGLTAGHQCGNRGSLSLVSFIPTKTVAEKNALAFKIMLGWCFVAGFLIIWSICAVALVPRKPPYSEVHAKKLNLADEDGAWQRGFLRWASLSWADNLLGRYGKCWQSVIDDKELVADRMDSEYMPYVRFKQFWTEQVEANGIENASFFKPCYKLIGTRAVVGLVLAILVEVFMSNVGMVIALDKFLGYLEDMGKEKLTDPDKPQSILEPTILAIILIFGVPMCFRTATIVVHLIDGYYTNICAAGIGSILFEKALSMPVGVKPPQELDNSDGYYEQNMRPNVVQLLNVDIIECWGYLLKTIIYIIVSPLLTIVLFVMLIRRIHLAGLIGVLYIIPCTLFNMKIMGFNIRMWIRYQGFQDERLRWLTETVIHIRTIKSLAWEKLSFTKLQSVREKELECNQWCGVIGGLVGAVGHTMPWGTMLLAAFASLCSEGYLQAHTIIVIQRLMGSLLHATSIMLDGVHKFVTVPNSFRRIRKFLMEPDLPRDVVRAPALLTPDAPAVRMKGSFSFVDGKPPVLHDLDISIKQGEFVAVVGAVASGKSAFVQALLGELYVNDDAFVEAPMTGKGEVAYCSQVPWIFEGTLRDNVLLNSGLQPERYYSALYSAALLQDLEILPGSDQVTIGSYGIRLSGGQRARVALARAAYQEHAHLVIVDDPFASVDVPTGQHIMDHLLLGPLMEGRTRVVVMQPSAAKLRLVDRVLLLENGRCVAFGPPKEVMEHKVFLDLLAKDTADPQLALPEDDATQTTTSQEGSEMTARVCERKAVEAVTALREAESQDHVTFSTIIWWFKAAGIFNLAFYVCGLIAGRYVGLMEALAVAHWVDSKMVKDVNDRYYMVNLLKVIVLNCVVVVFASYASTRVSRSASTILHSKVIHAILRAPVDKFFDKQPVGRLINRLSFDMRRVDDAILGTITQLLGFVTGFIITESFILRVVPLKIALSSIPVFAASFYFIFIFRGTAVPLVFHSKFSLSSIQDLQATILTSCLSVRANNMVDSFMQRFNHYSHSIIRSQYLIYHVCACWVTSRVFLCFSCLTCIFAVGGLYAGMPIGTLSVVIGQQFAQMSEFEALAGGFTALLNILNALQRLTKYFTAPQEAPDKHSTDVEVRRRVQLPRGALRALEVRPVEGKEAKGTLGQQVVVCLRGGAAVLQSTADGTGLELVHGRWLTDLAPGDPIMEEIGDCYRVVGVNSASSSAEQMAQELCHPTNSIWIDLWHTKFAEGMHVKIEELTAGYCTEKNVLHSINVDILPRMKMALVGRTGCGKSTTMLCLLRLLEPRNGRVLFGGVDSKTIGLHTLRNIVGLVPQDPTIFEGSLRTNIDPFNEFPDARIWEALRSMQLLPYVRSQPGGINSQVTKEGGNMSFGQRQLLSMTRMHIRQPPVLLLDECTSALDPNTQEIVQETILHEFPRTTTIAIAHRVETILDFDRVTVFEKGKVVEQGPISDVLQIKKGIFAGMVKLVKPTIVDSTEP